MNRLAALLLVVCLPAYSATYYVRSAGGNDGNAGTAFATGWATIQKAADTAVGGDVVLVCADGTHTPAAKVDWDTNAGTVTAPITFRGCGATGTDDGTQATITGASIVADDLFSFSLATASTFWIFENLRLTASTADNVDFGTGLTTSSFIFRDCRIDSAAGDGVIEADGTTVALFVDCEIDSNADDGIGSSNIGSRGGWILTNCRVHDNGGVGIEAGGPANTIFEHTLIYDNGSDGVALSSGAATNRRYGFEHCVIYGNTGDGIDASADYGALVIQGCVIASNGGYGINGATIFAAWEFDNICSNANTSGHTDLNGGTLPGSGHVLEDPNFVSVVDGSEDFTPQNSNLLVSRNTGAGTTYEYIGAIQPQASGGFFHPFQSVVLGQ